MDSLQHLLKHRNMLGRNVPPASLKRDTRLGVALNELGNAYLQSENAFIAKECFRQSVDELEYLTSSDTHTHSLTMPQINLGFSLWLQEILDEAAEEFSEVMIQRKDALGADDPVSFA